MGDFGLACHRLGGRYCAPYDTTALPYGNGEVDLVLSNLVLQCIPRCVLPDVIAETVRVLAPGGYAVHRIWMGDEYAGRDPNRNRLHYLTYSEQTWTRWFCHRLKHLNRLRAPQFLELFDEVGLEIWRCQRTVDEQSIPHLKKIPLDEQFQRISWEDLATTSLEIVLRKPLPDTEHAGDASTIDDQTRVAYP
jgi:SAM-dependent methyltransferase